MTGEAVFSERAPKPVGPYSQAIKAGGFIFVSGQLALDPATGRLVEGGIREQTRRALENLKAILEEAGYGLGDVVRVGIYLRSAEDFRAMNEVYQEYFGDVKPARTTAVAPPPLEGALVEVDAVAYRETRRSP